MNEPWSRSGAFTVVILLACGLAFYGIQGISTAGEQVVRL